MDKQKILESMNATAAQTLSDIERRKMLSKELWAQYEEFQNVGFPQNKAFALTQQLFEGMIDMIYRSSK